MKTVLKFVGVALIASVVGATGLTLLTLLAHWLFMPQLLEYWLAPLSSVPAGAILGFATGVSLISKPSNYQLAIWINVISCLLVLAWITFISKSGQPQIFTWIYFSLFPFLWIAAILCWSLLTIRKRGKIN